MVKKYSIVFIAVLFMVSSGYGYTEFYGFEDGTKQGFDQISNTGASGYNYDIVTNNPYEGNYAAYIDATNTGDNFGFINDDIANKKYDNVRVALQLNDNNKNFKNTAFRIRNSNGNIIIQVGHNGNGFYVEGSTYTGQNFGSYGYIELQNIFYNNNTVGTVKINGNVVDNNIQFRNDGDSVHSAMIFRSGADGTEHYWDSIELEVEEEESTGDLISNSTVRVNEQTTPDTGRVYSNITNIETDASGLPTNGDYANVTVRDNSSNIVLNNETLYNIDKAGLNNYANSNFTINDSFDLQAVNETWNYDLWAYDSSESKLENFNDTFSFENDLNALYSIPTGFNQTTLAPNETYDPFAIDYNNYHDYIDVDRANISYYIRERDSTNQWTLIEETSGNLPTDNSFRVLSSLNTTNISNSILQSNQNFEIRTEYELWNSSNGNTIYGTNKTTYHETTYTDSLFLNTFTEALSNVLLSPLDAIESAINNVIDTIEDVIGGLIDIVLESVRTIIDAIVFIVIGVINIISYILSLIVAFIDYALIFLLDYHQNLMLVNLETNETIDLDNTTNTSITTAFSDGYGVRSNYSIGDYISDNNKSFIEASDELKPIPVYEYIYSSELISGEREDAVYRTSDFNRSNWGVFSWSASNPDITRSDFNHPKNATIVSGEVSGGGTGNYYRTTAAVHNRSIVLDGEQVNITWSTGNELHTTDKDAIPSVGIKANPKATDDYSNYHAARSSGNSYPKAILTHESSTKWDIQFKNVNGQVSRPNANPPVNGVLETNDNRTYVMLLAEADNEPDATGGFQAGHYWYNTTTEYDTVERTGISVNWYTIPYDFPNGYPVGIVSLVSALSVLASFILGFIPEPVINGLNAIYGRAASIITATTTTLARIFDIFTLMYVRGIDITVQLAKLYVLFKGLMWGEKFIDEQYSMVQAAEYVLEDIKDQYVLVNDIVKDSIQLIYHLGHMTSSLINTIRGMIRGL